jgi:hypothetical protein
MNQILYDYFLRSICENIVHSRASDAETVYYINIPNEQVSLCVQCIFLGPRATEENGKIYAQYNLLINDTEYDSLVFPIGEKPKHKKARAILRIVTACSNKIILQEFNAQKNRIFKNPAQCTRTQLNRTNNTTKRHTINRRRTRTHQYTTKF